jgi:hypothetical protein
MHSKNGLHMTRARRLAAALCLALWLPHQAFPADAWKQDWRVVTVGRAGAWGVGTEPSFSQTMSTAIRRCKQTADTDGGCGARYTAVRGARVVGTLCAGEPMFAAGSSLADADEAALHREIDLQVVYLPDLPPCQLVLTVDPDGSISVHIDNWAFSR